MKPRPTFLGRRHRLILAGSIAAAIIFPTAHTARATNEAWNGSSTVNGLWSNAANWTGAGAPGSTTGTTSLDGAVFTTSGGNWGNTASNPVVIDAGRNIFTINFTGDSGSYFIGGTVGGTGAGGNALLLTNNGEIHIANTLFATNAVETIDAPLVLEGTNGSYAFGNDSANGIGAEAGTLIINGGVTGGAVGVTTLDLDGINTNANTVGGVIANGSATSLGVTKTSGGTWVLSGANTYTGTTRVNGGTLQAGIASVAGVSGAFGNNSAMILANAIGAGLNITGFNTQIGSLSGGGSAGGNVTLGSATLTVGGDNTSPAAYAGVLSGTGGALTKIGTGTLTLSGANTYTGATTLNGGTLALSFGTVSSNILPSASALTLGDGTFSLSGTGTQTVSGLTTAAGTGSQILLGSNETLTLGALTSAGANSALNFNTVAGGANATTPTVGSATIVLTGQTAGNAINTGFTVTDAGGFGLATVNASNQVVRLTTTLLLPFGGANSFNNYLINNNAGGHFASGSSSLTISTSELAKSITVDTTAASGVVSLNSGVTLSNNTWNFGGVGSNTWEIIGGSNPFTGLKTVSSGNSLNFNNYNSGTVTIDAGITANGTNAVNVYGTGTLIFAAANSYTGNTTVSGGTLQISTGGSISNNSSSAAVYVGYNPGDNGTLNIAGGGVASSYGYLGYNAGSTGTVTVSSGSWTLGSGFGASNLYVGYGGTGVLNVTGGTIQGTGFPSLTLDIGSSAGSTGVVNISSGSINSFGGTVDIGQGAGSTGTVTVSGGTLTGIINVGDSGIGVLNITGGSVAPSGTLTLAKSAGSTGTLNLGTGGTVGTLQANVVSAGSGTAVVNFNHFSSYAFTPQLTGSLSVNQIGAGATILSTGNSYTGGTNISAGQLIATKAFALGSGAVTVGAGAGLSYAAGADTPLIVGSTLAVTGGTGTALGGSIGSTTTSAEINVLGAASATGAVQLNVYGISGGMPLVGTNIYTLLTSGAGSSLNGATWSLGTVYGNTNFTVGGVTSTASTLQVAVTSATPITGAYWTGGLSGATNVWSASNGSTASNWATTAGGAVQGLVPGAGANVVISATSPVTSPASTVLGANMSIASLTIADTVNGLGLAADGFTLTVGAGGITMNAGVPGSSIGTNVVLGSSQTWTNNSANSLTVSGNLSGNSSLTKAGTGTVILSGTNTNTGAITINAGTLQLGQTYATGNNTAVTLANVAGANLNLAGFTTQISSLNGGGSLGGNIALGAGSFTIQSNSSSPATYAGVISGTWAGTALMKSSPGTLTLTGASTYAGETIVSGTLVLAFGSVTTNILPTTTEVLLESGTLSLSGTGTQTVNIFGAESESNQILLGANQTLTIGSIVEAGIANFNTAAGGANATTSTVGTGTIAVLNGQTAGNVISTGFTVTDAGGFGLATVNASNQVVRLTTTSLLPASGATSTTSYLVNNNAGGASSAGSSSLVATASQSVASITVDTTAASGVLTLNPGVVLSSNTWNFGGNGSNTWQITGSASGAGLQSVNSGNPIDFNNYNFSAVTLSSPILNNGGNEVNIYGTGTLIFAATNTYNGGTTISGGTLQIPNGGSISPTSGSTSVTVGADAGDNGTLNLTGGSITGSSGYLAYYAGSSGTATVGSGSWTMSSSLEIGSGGTGVLNLNGGTISASYSDLGVEPTATGTATVTGGTLTISTQLNVGWYGTGVLNINGGSVSSASSYVGNEAGSSGTVTVSNGSWTANQLYLGSSGTGVLSITGNGIVTIGNAGAGTLNLAAFAGSSGALNLGTGGSAGTLQAATVAGGSGTAVVNFNHTGSYSFAPNLTGSLSVNQVGGGTTVLTGTNTYTGPTTVQAGALIVDGSISGAATVSGAGTILGGNGAVGGASVGSGAVLEGGDGSAAAGALSSGGTVSLASGSIVELTLGSGDTSSSLARTGGTWSFDLNQKFIFNLESGVVPGTYDDLITGLTGTEPGLANVTNWTISNPGLTGAFSYDNAGNVDLTLTATPEPTTAAALLLGGLPLLRFRRRQTRPPRNHGC